MVILEQWEAISNGNLQTTLSKKERTTIDFAESDKISTYVFSFTGGKFKIAKQDINKAAHHIYLHRTSAMFEKIEIRAILC